MSSASSTILAAGFASLLATSGEALTLRRAAGVTTSVVGLINETEKDEGDRRGVSASNAVIEISTEITVPPVKGEAFVTSAGDYYAIAQTPTRIGYRWQCVCRKSIPA